MTDSDYADAQEYIGELEQRLREAEAQLLELKRALRDLADKYS